MNWFVNEDCILNSIWNCTCGIKRICVLFPPFIKINSFTFLFLILQINTIKQIIILTVVKYPLRDPLRGSTKTSPGNLDRKSLWICEGVKWVSRDLQGSQWKSHELYEGVNESPLGFAIIGTYPHVLLVSEEAVPFYLVVSFTYVKFHFVFWKILLNYQQCPRTEK